MNKSTSFYLDLLRVIAAFGVILVHANLPWFSNNMFIREQWGHKLVMVFFVLSGYLIAFTVDKKNKGARSYLVDRFSRLYSVVIPALLFTYIIDFIGRHYNPVFYADKVTLDHQFFRFALNATFLQQIWGLCTRPSSNTPFWSISYEFWYYMLFWGYCYLNGIKKYLGLTLICLLIGVKILLLLPVWVFGVLAYKYSNRLIIKQYTAVLLFMLSLVVMVVLTCFWDFSFFEDKFIFGQAPLYFSSRFIFDWVYGLFVALNLFCLNYLNINFTIAPVFNKSVKYLSSITFSVYLFHLPILTIFGGLLPYDKSNYYQLVLLLVTMVVIVALLSIFTEKQRNRWKLLFERIFHSNKNSYYNINGKKD